MTKKYLGYFFGAMIAVLMISPVLFLGADYAGAQASTALTADELFGGKGATGSAFAGNAGLGTANLTDTIASIIRVALGFLGVIAVVIILLGGFKWMTAAGNDDKVKDAKKLIISGIIGLVIVLSAYAIASFVITQITSVTATTTSGGGGGGT